MKKLKLFGLFFYAVTSLHASEEAPAEAITFYKDEIAPGCFQFKGSFNSDGFTVCANNENDLKELVVLFKKLRAEKAAKDSK